MYSLIQDCHMGNTEELHLCFSGVVSPRTKWKFKKTSLTGAGSVNFLLQFPCKPFLLLSAWFCILINLHPNTFTLLKMYCARSTPIHADYCMYG